MAAMPNQSIAFLALLTAFILGCAKDVEEDKQADSETNRSVISGNGKPSPNDGQASGEVSQAGDLTASSVKPVTIRMPNSALVTDDVFGAVVVYPRQLLADPLFADVNLAQLIDEAIPDIGVSVADLEQVVWLLSVPEKLKRTLIATHIPAPRPKRTQTERASAEELAEDLKPPVNLDDLFEGLEPAKPVPPEEDRDFDNETEFDAKEPESDVIAEETGFHAFDAYWTPKFMPMILRFAEPSKADQFARVLTKGMSEAEWHGARYYKQERVSGKSPTISPNSTPAIRQYLNLEPMSVYLPDAYCVVVTTEPHMQKMLAAVVESHPEADSGATFEKLLDAASAISGATALIDFQRLRESGTYDSLLEEVSKQCLSSRMALLNLADDAGVVKIQVDVSAESLLQLELATPSDPASRERLSTSVTNLVRLASEYESSLLKPLTMIVKELVQDISSEESESEITLRTERSSQFEKIPPLLSAVLEQVVSEAEEALWRHSLEQIAFAMQIYAAEHNHLPASASFEAAGKPLLSWRVHLLPYLGHDDLYEQFHLDEPWNSAHNITLLDRMPSVYGKTGADTRVLVFTGPGTLFDRDRETAESVLASEQAGSTILLVRTDDTKPVAWSEPRDLDLSEESTANEVLGDQAANFLAAFSDASVRFVVPARESQTLDKMARPFSD